jgi:hypothetical protein
MTDATFDQRAVERALARLLVDTSSSYTAVVRVGGATQIWQGSDPLGRRTRWASRSPWPLLR